jgi:hypothetical protein
MDKTMAFLKSLLAMKGENLYKMSALMVNFPENCRRHLYRPDSGRTGRLREI